MAPPGRVVLPLIASPKHYKISIYDIEFGGSWSFKSLIIIDVVFVETSNRVVLNSHELEVTKCRLIANAEAFETSSVEYDRDNQRVTLVFPELLSVGSFAQLILESIGTITNDMAGFYRSAYKPAVSPLPSVPTDGHFHYMVSTQLEPCDARRVFPCFDEPNLKATFDLDLEIPEDQTALSNMPLRSSKPSKPGMKIVSFERTPLMSSYLLAWAIGDFECIETFTSKMHSGKLLPLRLYTTRGLKERGRLGLDIGSRAIDHLSEMFKIDFPLPKLDFVAVHEVCNSAMENWGLITSSTTFLLYDEKTSNPQYQMGVAYIIAHELAHMWFGNLVTMDWWDDLWLNEGFATWAGWMVVDHLYPEWDVWGLFTVESINKALNLDALRSSHPIIVSVTDALDINQVFDFISYQKGGAIIRMLSYHIGLDVFLRGVSNYLKTYSHGNATTSNLWAALSKASGQDVETFMYSWTSNIGFPLLSVSATDSTILTKQSRFLLANDMEESEDKTVWQIPLRSRELDSGAGSSASTQLLIQKQNTFPAKKGSLPLFNIGQVGFFRTSYPHSWLLESVQNGMIPAEELVSIIGDLGELAVAGKASTPELLSVVDAIKLTDNYFLFAQVLKTLDNVSLVFGLEQQITVGIAKFILSLASTVMGTIGWDIKPSDSLLHQRLRTLLIRTAGKCGHEGTIEEAVRRFNIHKEAASSECRLPPGLHEAVFSVVVTHGGADEISYIRKEYETTAAVDGKEICLSALGCIQDPILINDHLSFIFSPLVSLQDIRVAATSLAGNPTSRLLLWEYFKEHFDEIYKVMGGNASVIERFFKLGLARFAEREVARDMEKFFEDKATNAFERSLKVVVESIEINAAYKERDEEGVRLWLRSKGYC